MCSIIHQFSSKLILRFLSLKLADLNKIGQTIIQMTCYLNVRHVLVLKLRGKSLGTSF